MTTEENLDVVEGNLTTFRVTMEELTRCVTVLLSNPEGEGDQLNVANNWSAEKSMQMRLLDSICERSHQAEFRG